MSATSAETLEGQVALIVGSSRGIGAAAAHALAGAGAKVVLASVDVAGAGRVASAIAADGGEAVAVPIDVGDDATVAAAVEECIRRFGRLDAAVNNAGIQGPAAPLHEQPPEQWERIVDTNLGGVYRCMRHELRVMVEQRSGSIINTASVGGVVAAPGIGPYCASKHGVIGLTRSAALDYGPIGIRINAIAPGAVDTDIFNGWMESDADREAMAARHPLGRIADPGEIAGAVLWLASAAASYVTGSVVTIDGGYTAA